MEVLTWDLLKNEVWVSLNLAEGRITTEDVMMPRSIRYYSKIS